MSKKTPKAPKVPYAQILNLLDRLQRRLDAVDLRSVSKQSVDTSLLVAHEKINDAALKQSVVNKQITESLYALRGSTAKAFDNVTVDVKAMLTTAQRLNERIGKVESQNLTLASTANIQRAQIAGLETKVRVLEAYKEFVEKAFAGKD